MKLLKSFKFAGKPEQFAKVVRKLRDRLIESGRRDVFDLQWSFLMVGSTEYTRDGPVFSIPDPYDYLTDADEVEIWILAEGNINAGVKCSVIVNEWDSNQSKLKVYGNEDEWPLLRERWELLFAAIKVEYTIVDALPPTTPVTDKAADGQVANMNVSVSAGEVNDRAYVIGVQNNYYGTDGRLPREE